MTTNKKLTPNELRTLHTTDFFFIKSAATEKIQYLLSEVRDEIKTLIKKEGIILPNEVDISAGKISKGENYRGLPYLVLDYPKYFSLESTFTFRIMFWWGNFFSCTLHLQGNALDERRKLLIQNRNSLRKKNIYICVNDSPWEYHYKKDNYVLLDKFSETEIKRLFTTNHFIKLSRRIALKDYKQLTDFCKESFLQFILFSV